MKIILAPTDFSKVARNAVEYAVEIAKRTKAKLVLFHVYHATVVPAEIPIVIPAEEFEQEAMKNLEKIRRSIHLKHGKKLSIECQCRYGYPVDEIDLFARKNKIDMIVMGMEGTGFLTEKLIGSITTSLINKAKYPVLAIGKQVKFKDPKKITLAFDYGKTKKRKVLTSLKEFIQTFKSHVSVLNVIPEAGKDPAAGKVANQAKLDRALDDIPHSFHYKRSDDVINGINDFIKEKKTDMTVMIRKDHTFFEKFFNGTHTKRMAFHSKVPLLVLHE
jgi:nucleotide-binding universal stress UspA family protein